MILTGVLDGKGPQGLPSITEYFTSGLYPSFASDIAAFTTPTIVGGYLVVSKIDYTIPPTDIAAFTTPTITSGTLA